MNKDNIIPIKTKANKGHGGRRVNAGRPQRKSPPWNLLVLYARASCTLGELAAVAEMDLRTLKVACERDNNQPLKDWVDSHRAYGISQLKKTRFDMAIKQKSWKSIEWLSRQLLHETSTSTIDINAKIQDRVVTYRLPKNNREIDMRPKPVEQVLEHQPD